MIAILVPLASSQILHDSIKVASPQGDSTWAPVAYVSIPLTNYVSLHVVAKDTSRPDSIDVCFASVIQDDLKQASLFLDSYSDLKFPSGSTSDLARAVLDTNSFVVVRVSWNVFEQLCSQTRIVVSTPDYFFTFTELAGYNLNELRKYLLPVPGERRSLPPLDFVTYDKEPTVLSKVAPTYPESALQERVEGNVYVKAWVDISGNVRNVVVLKADQSIFVRPAIQAAKAWKFTPAFMNGRPVDVWVAIPFRFRLVNR